MTRNVADSYTVDGGPHDGHVAEVIQTVLVRGDPFHRVTVRCWCGEQWGFAELVDNTGLERVEGEQ